MNSKSTIPNHEDIPLWFEFRYGLCLLEIGNSAEAIRQFQRLTRRNPDNSVYWECLGLFSKIEPEFDWLTVARIHWLMDLKTNLKPNRMLKEEV